MSPGESPGFFFVLFLCERIGLMKRTGFLASLILIAIFLSSCGGDGSASSPRTWTFLVYMDGDNNLSDAALADLSEMEAVGSSGYVNIIVQLDLDGGVSTKRYKVLKGSRELISADLGELDMANPQTLTDFLVWGKENYPADRMVVVLWNHGNGWDQGDGPSKPAGSQKRSIFYDDDNGSPFLSNHQVKKAIERSGINIDILGLDASIMGTIEALYEFKDLAPIVISSQEVGHDSGWVYEAILSRLEDDPGMEIEDLSRIVVSSYRDFFEKTFYPSNPNYEKRHTISAMHTTNIGNIGEEVDRLAAHLMSLMDDPGKRRETFDLIQNARYNAQEIDKYVTPYVYVDLVDLDRLLAQGTDIAKLISEATIEEYHGSARPNAYGMSIVFFKMPEAKNLTYDPNYRDYDSETNTGNGGDFINRFSWDEFLDRYYMEAGLFTPPLTLYPSGHKSLRGRGYSIPSPSRGGLKSLLL